VRFRVGLAQALDLPSASVDAVISGLVLNFVPQPEQAVSEMLRVARPGATVGAFVWDYARGMEMLRIFWDAALKLDQAAGELDEGRRFPLCMEGGLERLLKQEGLQNVQACGIEIETVFQDFADYWEPFLGNVGPASAYVLSLESGKRKMLEDELQQSLPARADGSIPLTARAWAARGIVG
jgi:ubiquinone/menaquinone biosynthesis C-methylase UbiE